MFQVIHYWTVTFKNEDGGLVELVSDPDDLEACVRILKTSGIKNFNVQEQGGPSHKAPVSMSKNE